MRSIANMVGCLGDQIDFSIVTSDRDELDKAAYPNVTADTWTKVGHARVYYCSPGNRSLRTFSRLLTETSYDAIYLNSFFDPIFTIRPLVLRRFGRLRGCPTLLAPRGEFSPGALQLKRWKKTAYVQMAKNVGLYNDLVWHASNEYEKGHIQTFLEPVAQQIRVAANLTEAVQSPELPISLIESRSERPVRIVYLSRISPKKNLEFALRVLGKVSAPVEFTIYGPISDQSYWEKCQRVIASLPANISVTYAGYVEHHKVAEVLASNDLFFLPTQGENYGHVIIEALAAGTPVLVSDQTPWRGLEKPGVGWDLPLSSEKKFGDIIESLYLLSDTSYVCLRSRAKEFAREHMEDSRVIQDNLAMFYGLLRRVG